jgi:hypothetical protein
MVACDSGTFREGWVMFSDPRASTCTECGANILSTPRDLDENPKVANGSLTRATSASCCKWRCFWLTSAVLGLHAAGYYCCCCCCCALRTWHGVHVQHSWLDHVCGVTTLSVCRSVLPNLAQLWQCTDSIVPCPLPLLLLPLPSAQQSSLRVRV